MSRLSVEAEGSDYGGDVREIVEDEIRPGGFQCGAIVATGRNAHAAGVNGLGARDVVRRVANDEDVRWSEIDPVKIRRAAPGEGAKVVAILRVVRESAEGEVVVDAVVAELEIGPGAQVTGQEADGDMGETAEGVEDLREAGKEASIGPGELRLEVIEVPAEEEVNVFGMGLDAVGLEDALRDPYIGLARDFDIAEGFLAPKAVAQRHGERFLTGAPGIENGLVNVKEDELGFHGEKWSGRGEANRRTGRDGGGFRRQRGGSILAGILVVLVLGVLLVVLEWEEAAFALGDRERRKGHADALADELGLHLDMGHRGEVALDALHEGHAQLLVRHLAATELEVNLELVALVQEALGAADLREIVVVVNIDPEFDFLELAGGVFLLLVLLGQLVAVLAEINNSADWGNGVGGDLDEVEPQALCFPQCIRQLHHAKLLIGGPEDDAHLARPYAAVDSNRLWLDKLCSFWPRPRERRKRPVILSYRFSASMRAGIPGAHHSYCASSRRRSAATCARHRDA